MSIAQALLSFALVAALLTVIPGLDTALVLRGAIVKSRHYAFATAAGISAGTLVWGVAAAVGASALLSASELAYRVLTLAGAAYMVWLGLSMIWKSRNRNSLTHQNLNSGTTELVELAPVVHSTALRGFLIGAGTNLLNPKVGVFYIATIPLFIPAGTSPLLMGILLASVHVVLGLIWFTAIILGTGFAGRWLKNEKGTRIVDRVTGVVLIGFGVKLALQPH